MNLRHDAGKTLCGRGSRAGMVRHHRFTFSSRNCGSEHSEERGLSHHLFGGIVSERGQPQAIGKQGRAFGLRLAVLGQ